MIVSGLVSAYRFYKDYVFKENIKCTLNYILSNQNHFNQNILTNKRNLLSLAEIASSNFKDVHADISKLKSDTNNMFDTYLTNLYTPQLILSSTKTMFCIMSTLYIILTMILLLTTIGLRE